MLYCDLWGCLHEGRTPVPAAVAALRGVRAEGGRVVLMTNAPRPNRFVAAQLDRMAVPRDAWDMIVSSGDAAQAGMFAGLVGRRVYHLGPEKDAGFFTEIPTEFADAPEIVRVPLAEAEGIVCTGPFDEMTETPEDYRATLLYAKAKAMKLLCTNPDIVVDFGDKRIYCAGALADFEQAIRLEPKDPAINNAYGLFLCTQGRGKEGIEKLMVAARDPLYPNPTYPYTNAGMCSLWIDEPKAAEDYLRRAVIADSQNTQAVYLLALVHSIYEAALLSVWLLETNFYSPLPLARDHLPFLLENMGSAWRGKYPISSTKASSRRWQS